jgi:hypothetical protein
MDIRIIPVLMALYYRWHNTACMEKGEVMLTGR